jgi:nitroreductase
VRDFTEQPVSDEIVRERVDAAIQAPSAVNLQPWSFAVVRGREMLDRISGRIAAHVLRTAPVAASAHFQAMVAAPGFDILHRAPALIVISSIADSQKFSLPVRSPSAVIVEELAKALGFDQQRSAGAGAGAAGPVIGPLVRMAAGPLGPGPAEKLW